MIIGAIKIKDGLFIGDEFASKDLEFVVSNKVTHIINCSGRQLPNVFETFGVKYLKFNWVETDQQILFEGLVVQNIFDFIEEAHSMGESCLVHSTRGLQRSCCALAAFFMRKYKWKLYKTLEFLNSRRPDLEIRASFYHQLTQLETKLQKKSEGAISSSWDPNIEQEMPLDQDEKLLRNTFQNSKQQPPADCWLDRKLFVQYLNEKRSKAISWADESKDQVRKSHKKKPSTGKPILKDILADKISNINGNVHQIIIYNNYQTPQEQLQPKINNYFEQKNLQDNLSQKVVPKQQIKRQQNDSLKKYQELKQSSSNSPYQYNSKTKPKTAVPKKETTDTSFTRPKSAYVPNQQEQPTIPKAPSHGRQFSPLVKTNTIPKPQLIQSKNKGWRYPSPGVASKVNDEFLNTFLNKPTWK